ncbi:MAG: hypothetical protein K1X55_16095 [Chitinophagales bacterium]|nr:hypothetical protein [Chitinophagales bacterium]
MRKILLIIQTLFFILNINAQKKLSINVDIENPIIFNDFKIQISFENLEDDSILFPKNYCVDNTSTPFHDVDIVQILYGVNNEGFLIEDVASMADIDCFIIEENRQYDTICRFNSKSYKINLFLFATKYEKTANYVLIHYAKIKSINGMEQIIKSNPIYFTVRKKGEQYKVKENKYRKRQLHDFPIIKW